MRKLILGFAVVAPLFVVAPVSAQQIVDTTTGTQHASGQCAVSQAMLAAIEQGQANREVDTKSRINAFLDNALASTRAPAKTQGQSPVVFPPVRSGG
ncbi:MAG: hypothetical protein HOL07_15360 [Rhodospirillaceae bacterium]|jgi:predicted transcriptional regulator|nr:hypothetical protein [Rhodospirillaceae bacterium]MBT5359718.1 hypothetical protein [Rhodospirillaceae bacterium]MBT5945841.1 hypothetical protein [Rhodospirillaceae bacterium]MBT6403491.1 hypothetical protein [Rhodospirillaceae bacterium]MBT7361409.1 hypothetical protein [Rhodospirillaceae bacterium]